MRGADDRPPPYVGDYPTGAYWSAERVDHAADGQEVDYSPSGEVIRFMWDYSVRIPLWDAEGLLPEEPEWLTSKLGLSEGLIEALADWGTRMNLLDARRWSDETRAEWDQAYADMDARARELVESLRRELETRYRVIYKPW